MADEREYHLADDGQPDIGQHDQNKALEVPRAVQFGGLEQIVRNAAHELDEEERRLREAWRQKGGKEGDLADRLKNTPLGPLAYLLPGAVNRNLTSATDWMSKTYTKASDKVKDFAHSFDDTWVGQTASKAKDTFERRQKLKYNVIAVTKVSDDEYLITARDSMYNRQTATLRTKQFYANGVMPTQEITELCRQKGWVFNIDDPNLSYTEETVEAPADAQASQSKSGPASPYTYAGGANASYTVSGTKPTERARTAADVAEEAIPSQDGMSLAVQRTIPDKLDRIIELLGGGKVTKPEGHVDGYDPTVEDPTQWNIKGTFTQEGVPKGLQGLILPDEPTQGPDLTQRDRALEPAPTERKRKPREQDVTAPLSDTFQTKSDVTQWVPESLQEQVGAIYDNSVKSKHTLGKFLNKLSRDLKLTNSQKKILDDLKRASTVIQDVSTRKEYVGKTLSTVLAYSSSELDAKQRKKALQGIRKDMADRLEGLQNEISARQEAAAKKREEKGKGLKGFMRNLKLRWLKFRRSPIGRWIMAHIPDDVKKEVKEAFEKAKGDVKKATDDVKKILTNHNKKAKPGQAQIDPKVLEATQLSGSGDEGESTPQDILQSAVPDATLQQEDQESSDDKTEHPIMSKVSSLFHRDRSEDAVANHNRVGFFGKMKNLFHKDRAQAVRDDVPVMSTVPTTQEVKATKQEGDTGKPPEGDLKFEGEAESLFHSDFRLFAQRQVADNQALLSAIAGITPGGKRKGILGSIIGAGGNIGKGLLGAYGRIMAAMVRMYGNIGKGLLIGGGKVLGGALKAAPAVGKALWTPAKLLGKASWWTTKKTAKGAWAGIKGIGKGAKWLGKKTGQGLSGVGGFLKKDWERTKEDMSGLWNRIKGIGSKDKKKPEYYKDENGRWHGPDGKFISEDQVPPEYKTEKESLASRIKNRVKGWFSKPSDPNAKKKEDDDNVWNRKGWKGLFKSAWEGTKKLGSGIAGLFSKDKEEGSEIPKAGKKLGLDLIFNKLNDIYTLLKEDRDRKVEQQKKEEEAKKDAAQAEANMSAEEQKAAIEAKQKRLEEEAAADAALKKDVRGGPAAPVQQVVQGEGGGEGDEEGSLLDMAKDAVKSKVLKFARNKLAARSMKLLRKTKWGRRLLKSPAGKLMRKGVGTLLQKGKIGTAGRIGKTLGGVGRVLGRATGSVGSKVASLGTKLIPGLAGKAGMLGGVGSKAMSFAGKAAAPLALAAVGYGAFKGLSANQAEDSQYAQDLGKEGLLKRAFKTAINPVRQGRIIASTLRNTFGLQKDLVDVGIGKLKTKNATSKLDQTRIAKLKKLGASEEDLKRYESLAGNDSNEALKEKHAIYVRCTSKKQTASSDKKSSSITIPANVAKALADTSDTRSEFVQELDEWLDDNHPAASKEDREGAIQAALSAHWGKDLDAGNKAEIKTAGESSANIGTSKKPEDAAKAVEGIPERTKAKTSSEATGSGKSDSGKLRIPQNVAQSLMDTSDTMAEFKSELRDYVDEYYPDASASSRRALIEATVTSMWGNKGESSDETKPSNKSKLEKSSKDKITGTKPDDAKAVLEGIPQQTKSGWGSKLLKAAAFASPVGLVAMGAKGLKWARGKAAGLAGKAADYLEGVAANAKGDGLLSNLKDIAATGSRALADKLNGGKEPGKDTELDQSIRSTNDVPGSLGRKDLQRSATNKLWDNLGFKGTKPTGAISTATSVQDKQINLKSDGVTEYIQGKQPDKSSDAALQQASSGNEALLKLTSTGNQDIVGKLAEMVRLMREQILVTADSKVAQEKASANGAANALQAAMKYAKETAQNAVADAKPKPQRAPAISVTKPIPA